MVEQAPRSERMSMNGTLSGLFLVPRKLSDVLAPLAAVHDDDRIRRAHGDIGGRRHLDSEVTDHPPKRVPLHVSPIDDARRYARAAQDALHAEGRGDGVVIGKVVRLDVHGPPCTDYAEELAQPAHGA
jgi:hypothetical protein